MNANQEEHSRGDGCCYAGECTLKMLDGSDKKAEDLVKGDKLATPDGTGCTIICVLKFKVADGFVRLCDMGKLKITGSHPIMKDGEWTKGKKIAEMKYFRCSHIYNLIVDRDHRIIVEGTTAVCMGHDYKEGPLAHPYLGSQELFDDLKVMPGWDEGCISFKPGCFAMINGDRTKLTYNGDLQHSSNV